MHLKIHTQCIIRRKGIPVENDYKKYRNYLREDFHRRCGYCSKPESLTTKGFEIDHFVPIKIDENRKTLYDNLVYSCFTCNRKKSSKWPTEDANVLNNGEVGFVDPASNDYELHLGRKATGEIEYYTPVGQYMSESVFKFNVRPIKIIWKLDSLIEKQDKLSEKISTGNFSEKEALLLAKICCTIKDLRSYIFEGRE
ncbi:HNH endonuclease [Lactococcus lactis subsp. lactis]|uniref:HNH endonuclease n=1 Tax=Lactococcus lactis subsp. lactis TaxID=1360 RepID=A0A2Z3KDN4_LACLL|nr:HNH endonuclease signature motif containing protein [Lactococcus lactis]AWN64921.1 HNH endonuclease [Lactococcus lactis subsp. lactis]